ncbi:hypothetical protein [Metabacillus sp. SLBN-84]
MQIHLGKNEADKRRVDFYGNAVEGVFVELVNDKGVTYFSKQITETERARLIETLTRTDNGRAV